MYNLPGLHLFKKIYEILFYLRVFKRGPEHDQISPLLVTVPLAYAYILVLLSHIRLGSKGVAYRVGGGVWGVQPPPPKFLSFDKAEPNSQFRGKYIRNNLTRIRLSLIF